MEVYYVKENKNAMLIVVTFCKECDKRNYDEAVVTQKKCSICGKMRYRLVKDLREV